MALSCHRIDLSILFGVSELSKIIAFSAGMALLLSACSSNLSEFGERHAGRVAVWQQLADYAGDQFSQAGVTLAASAVKTEQGYQLINFHLAQKLSATEINLLAPRFADKFVCQLTCAPISSFEQASEQGTALVALLQQHEGQIFEFYGELTNLNKQIALLKASDPELFQQYLNFLLWKNYRFNNLSDFYIFLFERFQTDALLAYARDDRLRHRGENEIEALARHASSAPQPFAQLNAKAPVAALSSKSQSTARTPDEQLHDQLLQQRSAKLTFAHRKKSGLSLAKAKPLITGVEACSFRDNSFGQITKVADNLITLKLAGQVKKLVDGIQMNAEPGLLLTNQTELYFVDDSRTVQYPKSDIFTCNITRFEKPE